MKERGLGPLTTFSDGAQQFNVFKHAQCMDTCTVVAVQGSSCQWAASHGSEMVPDMAPGDLR